MENNGGERGGNENGYLGSGPLITAPTMLALNEGDEGAFLPPPSPAPHEKRWALGVVGIGGG